MREWVLDRLNISNFPRLHFFADFVFDLFFVTSVNVAVRVFVWLWAWIDRHFPVTGADGMPVALHSYLPIEHVTYALTAVQVVSILMISFSAIMALVKVVRSRLT